MWGLNCGPHPEVQSCSEVWHVISSSPWVSSSEYPESGSGCMMMTALGSLNGIGSVSGLLDGSLDESGSLSSSLGLVGLGVSGLLDVSSEVSGVDMSGEVELSGIIWLCWHSFGRVSGVSSPVSEEGVESWSVFLRAVSSACNP